METNTSKRRFVGQKLAKLAKGPLAVSRTLSLSYRCPFANPAQVFDGEIAPGVRGFRDKALADGVVDISLEAALPAANSLQLAAARFGSDSLQARSHPLVVAPLGVNLLAAIGLAVRVGRKVGNSHIDAKNAGPLGRRRLGNVHHDGQIKRAVAIDEVGLPALPIGGKPVSLVAAHDDGDQFAPFECQERNAINPLPRQDALIIDYRAVGVEGRLDTLIPPVGFRHFGDGPDGHLRRQAERIAYLVVEHLLELVLASGAMLKGYVRNPIARFVEALHRREQERVLFVCRSQLDYQGCIHAEPLSPILSKSIAHPRNSRKHWAEAAQARALPPTAEAGGLPRRKESIRDVPMTLRIPLERSALDGAINRLALANLHPTDLGE